MKSKFLNHINYLRAFAIINIVFVHLWYGPSKYQKNPEWELIFICRALAFHDCTIYFIFISGFLFYYLSSNFELVKFYKSKLYNILCPYLFISCCLFAFKYLSLVTQNEFEIYSFLKSVARSLLMGKAQDQYWYIPFISLIFLISPLLLKIPKDVFQRIALLGFLLPLLGSRTGTDISIGQYVYFFPIYVLGIYVAMDYSNVISLIRKKILILISLSVISSVILIFFHGKDFHVAWINISESLFYIQKISICFLSIIMMIKLEDKKIVLLDYFAKFSFAIYFTHTLVEFEAVRLWYYNLVLSKAPGLLFPLSIFYVLIILFGTLFICMFLKKILGHYSRYIIGS